MTNWYDETTLPRFNRPPVVETAMSIEFAPVPGLDLFRLAELQREWIAQYPDISDQPAFPPTPAFDDPGGMQVNFGAVDQKFWAANAATGRLVQTQNDRLILNWSKNGPERSEMDYPGYNDALRGELSGLWDTLNAFASSRHLHAPLSHMVEFTYVNVVPLAPDESLGDFVTVVRAPEEPLPGTDRMTRFNLVRDVPADGSGRYASQVHINGAPQPQPDGTAAFVFTVTARSLTGPQAVTPFDALDAAHALASHSFARVITNQKQELWGRSR